MKTREHRAEGLQRNRFEADLEASIHALFRRCPTLSGFAVRDTQSLYPRGPGLRHGGELFITEVSVYPLSGLEAPGELRHEIATALCALLDECPQAVELLRERTFARVFH